MVDAEGNPIPVCWRFNEGGVCSTPCPRAHRKMTRDEKEFRLKIRSVLDANKGNKGRGKGGKGKRDFGKGAWSPGGSPSS